MKSVYISGPMTGKVALNFPAFHAEAERLRALGHVVVNPAEINKDVDAEWGDCLRADLKALMDCTAIVLLPGWEKSRGARLEFHNAEALEMDVHLAGDLVEAA